MTATRSSCATNSHWQHYSLSLSLLWQSLSRPLLSTLPSAPSLCNPIMCSSDPSLSICLVVMPTSRLGRSANGNLPPSWLAGSDLVRRPRPLQRAILWEDGGMMGDGRVEGGGRRRRDGFSGDVMHLLAAMLEVRSELTLSICRGSITSSLTHTGTPTPIRHHPPLHHPSIHLKYVHSFPRSHNRAE